MPNPPNIPSNIGMPMYGEMVWTMSNYTCVMTRSWAKIEVHLAPNYYDITGNFNAETVTWGPSNYGRGVIKPTGTEADMYTTGVHLNNAIFQRKNLNDIVSGYTLAGNAAYIGANSSSTRTLNHNVVDSIFHHSRTHLALIKLTDTDTSYYRLDFYDHQTGKFLDIKANHHYIFTINGVRSEGYSMQKDISHNPLILQGHYASFYTYGSNLEYTVRITDGSKAITSNGQYAIVTRDDTIRLPAGSVTVPDATFFRYEDPVGEIQILTLYENVIAVENVIPATATMTTTPSGGHISEFPIATVPITPPNSHITATNQPLEVTVSSDFVSGTIYFKFGNIEHRVYVERE